MSFRLDLLGLNHSLENTIRFPNLLDNGQAGNRIRNPYVYRI